MTNYIKSTYNYLVSHLTKLLGMAGTALMSLFAFIDPASIRSNAELYLGQHAAEKMGAFLFALVILRGFYTGWKAKQIAQQAAQAPK